MEKANYYSYLLTCVIMLIVAQFGVATVPLLGGKKLIIGLPMNSGLSEKFVDVRLDPITNQLDHVTGYSIDIFNATVDYLLRYSGFNVSYEFRPFINESGQSAGTYDELVEQVYNHQFGVVTGVTLLGGKKLIIGLPYKSGFTEFVDVKLDPRTYKLVHVTGYSVEIFNAILSYFSFNVSYEFKPFINETGQSNGSYDKLVEQIYYQQYDAVVGDVSIVASRLKYVDFTLPYAESGVRMLVRVGHGRHLNMWIFLRPFSWDLWLSIAIACAFIGATIQFMERNTDNEAEAALEGSPRRQQPKGISIIWLPLAQVVLPERESVAKSCSKFVLVVWLILALVLMQSYTASLSSILTVDQLQPSYPSVDDLRRNGENIGYPTGSWMFDKLVDELKFDKSKLKDISDMEGYRKALDNGTPNGGVAVIFDEIPYIKMFLKKYGSKYMMAGLHYRTDGLGFAFPINSNLTSYFSRAILNVTQNGDFMEPIERKYFGSSDYDLQDESDQVTSNPSSLTSQSFAGLFMITGIATVLALVVSESRIWRKHVTLAKVYSQKLLLSPPWTKSKQSVDVSAAPGNGSCINEPNGISESPSYSPHSNLPLEPMHHV